MSDYYDTHQPPPPPPPPPPWRGEAPASGFQTAALVCGIVGAVLALIPILGLFGLALGLVAVVLGGTAIHRRAGWPRGMAIAGTFLGVVAIVLGVIGMTIVNDSINELDRELDDLDFEVDEDEGYTPPSADEIDQATDDELWELWFDSPGGSEAEADIEAELRARGEM